MKKPKNKIEFDIEDFQKKVASDIQSEPGDSLESLERFLAKWWCRHYNRPYKEIDTMDYTLEELLYEFFDIQLRQDKKQLEKILGKEDEEEVAKEDDEQWLKEMMGDAYRSKEAQEKELEELRPELEDFSDKEEEELPEFSREFDLSEFE